MSKLEEMATRDLVASLATLGDKARHEAEIENRVLRALFHNAMKQRQANGRGRVRQRDPIPEIFLRTPGNPFSRVKIRGEW